MPFTAQAQTAPPEEVAPVPAAAPGEPNPDTPPRDGVETAPATVPAGPKPDLPAPVAKAGTKDEAKVSGAPGKGFTVDAGDAFSMNVRARMQVRYQLDIPRADENGERELEQTVNIGTARLWLSGHVYQRELTYMLQLAVAGRDFRDGATSPIYDAYLDYAAHRDLKFRVGQYFVPFDRLRTIREWGLQMADRPRPVAELTLDRDVGVMAYSDEFLGDESPVAFRLGAFGGGGINLSDGKEPGVLLVGRVELRPLGSIDDDVEGDLEYRDKPALAIGAGIANNWNTNRLRSTTGPTFDGGTTDYFHAATDLVFKWMGFAVQAEYLWKEASVDQIDSVDETGAPVTEYTRSGHGWVLQASYTFDPPFEVVGRLSRLYAADGTDPAFQSEVRANAQEVGAGLNYYFSGHRLKLQADYIARMPSDFDFGVADHVTHLQLDATF
ncbi:MAG TPA: hypothetical protein VI072_14580 [Polyangiaceae bacterium]